MLGIDVAAPPSPEEEARLAFMKRYAEDSGKRLLRLREKPDPWWEEDTKFFDVRRSRAWVMTRRLTHTSHHRGQLMAMLRMLGHEVYSNYGPTADTGGLMQNHAPTIYAYPTPGRSFQRRSGRGRQSRLAGALRETGDRTARHAMSGRRDVMITLKRAYDPVSRTDGRRFLVERLWPRGRHQGEAPRRGWLKDVGPSTELRKWFGHDPQKWDTFRRRYARELDSRPEAWKPIVSAARRGTCDADLQLARHGTQQCGRLAAVPASEDAETATPARTVARRDGDRVDDARHEPRPLQFCVRPVPPFRLDLTVWALRRRPRNLVDRWDGVTYRRVVVRESARPMELAVRQTVDRRRLRALS